MIKKLTKIFFRIFISAFIAFLSVSIIILIILLLIVNHKVFLKYAGIDIQHDCQIEKGHFICSYYKATDKNGRFEVSFNDIEGYIILHNFLSDKPIFQAKIDKFSGFYNPNKKGKNKQSLLPIYYFYIFSKFVNINLQNGKFTIKAEKTIKISDINLNIKNSLIYNKNPIKITFKNNKASVNKLYLKLTEYTAFLEDLSGDFEFLNNKLYFSSSGFLTITRKFYLNGTIKALNFSFKENKIKSLKAFFSIKKTTKYRPINIRVLTATEDFFNSKEKLKISKISTIDQYILKNIDDFYGNSNVYINNIQIDKLKINQTDINFSLEKKKDRLKGKTKINIFDISLKQRNLKEIFIDVSFLKWKFNQVNGFIKTPIIKANFSYEDAKAPVFKLNTEDIKLKKIIDFINPKKRNLFLIEGTSKISLTYFPDSSTANVDIKTKNLNLFGILFKNSNTLLKIDILKNKVNITGTAENKTTRVFYAGNIKNKNIYLNVNYSNLDLKDLIFTKKFEFSSIVSGNGYIKGNLLSPEIVLYGTADQMKYKQILLKDINYSLFYKKKQLVVVGEKKEKNILANVFVKFVPFSMLIDIYGKNSDITAVNPYLTSLLPKVFEKIKPEKATGNVKIKVKKNFWNVYLDIEKATAFLTPIKDVIYGYGKGTISKEKSNLKIKFYNNQINIFGKKVSIKGNFELLNKDFFIDLNSDRFDGLDKFKGNGFLFTQLEKNSIIGNFWIEGEKGQIELSDETLISGTLEKIGGISKLKVKQDNQLNLDTTLNYLVNIKEKQISSRIFTENILLRIYTDDTNQNYSLLLDKINIDVLLEKDKLPKATADINSINVSTSNINLLKSDKIRISFENMKLLVDSFKYHGLLNGTIKKLVYDLKNENLFLYTTGNIGKELIPEILQFFSLKGDVAYQVLYEGNIKKIKEDIYVKFYSNNLIIRTPYVIGSIDIDKFLVEYQKELKINITGKTVSSLFGENPIQIRGTANITPLIYNLKTIFEMLPVKYENLFVGTVNSNLDIITKNQQNHIIKGNISVSGRSKLPISFLTEKRAIEEKPLIFEKISLDINVDTFSPIYVYGSWGNVYAEASLRITGTLAKPVLNGEIDITYGKIYIAKNLYNVDFINVRIIDNKPFVNARLSTNVAQTFIYLNITGPIDDLQFEYVSTPPKTKEEILAILFLKETPSALAELPFFALVGKLIKAIFPVSPEKGGIFQTGFEISINPKYSPIQGIIASIYARKSITRRLYIAISRPILQTVTELFGWYELGFKITERTAIVFRQYENNITETEITFSLPFDF